FRSPLLIVPQRNPFRSVTVLYFTHRHHAVQLRNRKRTQQGRIRHAEHRRVHANPNRQRQNRRHRKPRRLPQLPPRKPEIVQHPCPRKTPVISSAIVSPFHSSPKLLNLQSQPGLANPPPCPFPKTAVHNRTTY